MIPHIGPFEAGLIIAIIFIVFGAGKLPQVGRDVGKALHAYRKGQHGEDEKGKTPGNQVVRAENDRG